MVIRYPWKPRYDYEAFSISPSDIFVEKTYPKIKAYVKVAEVQLCAIGCSHQGQSLLMIGPNGLLYGGFDEYFWQEEGEGLSVLIAIIRVKLAIWKTEVKYTDF